MPEREPSMYSLGNTERAGKNRLLNSPEPISPEEIRLGDKQSSFVREDISRYLIGSRGGQLYFVIEYYDSLPDELTADEKAQFTQEKRPIRGVETDVYVLAYVPAPEIPVAEKEAGARISVDYHVAQPRYFTNYELGTDQRPTPVELAEYIREHRVVFYTDAGISKFAGLPDQTAWQKAMGINLEKDTDDFLRQALHNPAANLSALQQFRQAAAELPPTPAHKAVKTLAQKIGSQILTENTDLLHERSGVRALHISGQWLRDNVQEEWLKDVDGVVTVGLSADDRGFLAWYKQHNPDGKIIAINVQQPNYVGAGDAVVEGDAQTILPAVAKLVQPYKH